MANEHYYTEAVWSATSPKGKSYPALAGDREVDIAIVGAGITGLTTAYTLSKAGKKVIVLDAKQVGMGTTGSSTGNLYAAIDQRLYSIESKHNKQDMQAVVDSRTAAMDLIEQLIKEFAIDCDFVRVPWYLFSTPGGDFMSQVEKERKAVAGAGLTVSGEVSAHFPYKVESVANMPYQAQFNPLKYVRGLAAALDGPNCRIFENTKVLDVQDGDPCLVKTSSGTIKAKQVIMATHSPKGIYAVHTAMQCKREYAMAVKIKGDLPLAGIYWHIQQIQQHSVRPYRSDKGNYLVVLGAPHTTGNEKHNENNFKKVEEYLRQHFEVESINYTWAAQNYRPADHLPYIGTSPTEKNTFIATGFAADGLVWGTLAAMLIRDAITGKENKWASLYDPKRFTPVASAANFIKEGAIVAGNLLKDYLFYGEASELNEVKAGEGKTIMLNDERLAAYRDEHGKLHIVSSVCPHMGCIVHFNTAEKSWDCPCHGSRFSVEGEVLEGPAYHNLAKPKDSIPDSKI
jgi:glycine/D-amino acid oxidase-like deaminating enzyme/nitrite reductase/ring-hydroxylating ferredoxin subunit